MLLKALGLPPISASLALSLMVAISGEANGASPCGGGTAAGLICSVERGDSRARKRALARLVGFGSRMRRALVAAILRVEAGPGRWRKRRRRRRHASIKRTSPAVISALAVLLPRAGRRAVRDLLRRVRSDRRAVGTLRVLALAAPEIVASLGRGLSHRSRRARRLAAQALAHAGPAAVTVRRPLIRALADGDAVVREAAARALGKIGAGAAPAIPALTRALLDGRAKVVLAAIGALSTIGPLAASALPALPALLELNDRPGLRFARRRLFIAIRELLLALGRRAHAPLLAWLASPSPLLRLLAIDTLGRLRAVAQPPGAAAAMVALLKKTKGGAEEVALIRALGHAGPTAPEAASVIAARLKSPHWMLRVHAAAALERMGVAAAPAVGPLAAALDETFPSPRAYQVTIELARALQAIGKAAAKAAPALTRALEVDDAEVKRAVRRALRAIGGTGAAGMSKRRR